ncbi:tipC [Symbiodinium sp. KB8]|nr:tipC [Symbiodinium sp. KB8]
MVTAAIEHVLVKFLQPYVDGIDSNDLRLSLWSGNLELKDLKVKEDVLGLLGVEGVRVRNGRVHRIKITLPSKTRLLSGKISVEVEGVQLQAEHLTESLAESVLRKNMRDTKLQAIELRMAQLRDVWRRKQQAQEAYDQAEPGFGIRFARRLVNNLSLELSKVDVSFSSLNPAAVGAAKMTSLQVLSTDSSFRRFKQDEVLEAKGTSLYKILSFDGLSLAYGQSMEALANLVSPVRAELKLGHVPDDGLLRLEVDLGTDKPTEIHTKRSQLIGVLALKTALSKKWEELRKLLVDPKSHPSSHALLHWLQDKYFKLFRQRCLANVDVTEEKVVAALYQTGLNCSQLEQPEQQELETLETVLPVQLLASARCRAEDFITELVKKAKPQKKSGGWFSRTFFGHKEPEESSLDKLSVEDLLTELQSAADVEVVEPPQKLVLMDIQDDTAVEVMQLLSLDLSTTSLAVNVESATDHKGQNSAAFSLFLALGSATRFNLFSAASLS